MSETRIRAPELPEQLEWFNTDEPLTLADQKGKVILLDFWSYCCIKCMHVLQDLAYLEKKYPDGLTVIGIHSPKFHNERSGANLQKAINRYYIRHPVANDSDFTLWRQYGIRAWPSIIFIDPEGYVVGVLRGDGRRHQLDIMIQECLEKAEQQSIRNKSPMPVHIHPEPDSLLKFPGKVLATPERLFVADSGQNRVIEAMHNGRILQIHGSGAPGMIDGSSTEAAFNNPQGMTFNDNHLYVADTGNHAVRRIDLHSRDVITVVGTGKQGKLSKSTYQDAFGADLNSPWDLVCVSGVLYIAMAGTHQIWRQDLSAHHLEHFAGIGSENIRDGDRENAAFAQPSGLVTGDYLEPALYIADAETSAIRRLRLRNHMVSTLIGTGLFEFGDRDGKCSDARLQHPLDISYDAHRNALWVADTYNHKIKLLDLVTEIVTDYAVACPLNEPGGVSFADNRLWIANTNAHQVVCVDLEQGTAEPVDLYQVETEARV